MSSWFVLEYEADWAGEGSGSAVIILDTTAPRVTLGAVGGAEAGALLQLQYVTEEEVERAFLRGDGRRLELAIHRDHFEAPLPPDWPGGPADVVVADDVGNERVYVGAVTIVGPTGPPPAPAPRGPARGSSFTAAPRRRQLRRDLVTSTPLRVRSTGAAAATASLAGAAGVSSAGTVDARVRADAAARVSTRDAPSATLAGASTVILSANVTVRRRDGPDLEEALLLGLFD